MFKKKLAVALEFVVAIFYGIFYFFFIDTEIVFRDATGALLLLNLLDNSVKELRNNATFVSMIPDLTYLF